MANTGRMNLLEEVGRIDAEKPNTNRRAEKRRVMGELNRGYNKGGLVTEMYSRGYGVDMKSKRKPTKIF
jgi:hypothetical protein|tara:strand:+ start:821 stop:1027 length:207 start_codon:yes stop_codon:yes gene_type:complete